MIRDLLERGMAPEDAAATALAAVDDVSALRALALPAVADRARNVARELTRRSESEACDGTRVDPLAARAALVDATFYVPGRGRVSWLRATAEEHDLRAAFQRSLAGGLVVDAERHESAAAQIRKARVSCLSEIGAES